MLRHSWALAAAILGLITTTPIGAQTPITKISAASFADAAEARKLLTVRDDFVERMSPFDRAARLKSADDVSVEQYLDFVGQNVLDWPAEEKTRVEAALAAIRPKLAELNVPLPETVHLVYTTGEEEGGACYTRGETIVLSKGRLAQGTGAELRKTLAHELFHVLSRSQPELKDKLYATIGFEPCGEVALPESLAGRRITNPDAPRNDHCIELDIEGHNRWALPILYSRTPTYDVRVGGEFFAYLQLKLMAVERDATGVATPLLVDGEPLLVDPRAVPDYLEKTGGNTGYIIHPEEILADNFALLVVGETSVVTPELLTKIQAVLREAPPAAAVGSRSGESGHE